MAVLCGTALSQSRRKQKTPRAIGLVEWPAKGNPVVVPIAILIDGRFYDAGIYMADPVPMALETGTVYEVEQSGDPVGFATLEGGINSNGSWVGAAKYQTREAALAPPKKSAPAFRPDPEEGPPRLHKGSSKSDKPEATPADKTASAPPSDSKQQTTSTASDDDRPRLKKPKDEQSSAPQANANPPAAAQTASAPPAPSAPSDDADYAGRPRLRRGKPVQTNAESAPAPSMARTTTTSTAVRGREAQNAGPVKVMAAISDAGGPESRSFTAIGSETVSSQMRTGIEDLARAALQKYSAAHGGANIGPLEKIEIKTFDLTLTNQTTVVLMASAHVAPPQPAPHRAAQRQTTPPPAASSADADLTYWVTVVARENYNGDLRQLAAWATDSKHLDAYPHMELIDALDADGDGRGELLFRAVSDIGRSFVIDRVTADQVVPLYDSAELVR